MSPLSSFPQVMRASPTSGLVPCPRGVHSRSGRRGRWGGRVATKALRTLRNGAAGRCLGWGLRRSCGRLGWYRWLQKAIWHSCREPGQERIFWTAQWIALNADAPPIEVHFLDYLDEEINELDARGIGEIGLAGVAAAITSAVHHATGVYVRELPVKIEDLIA